MLAAAAGTRDTGNNNEEKRSKHVNDNKKDNGIMLWDGFDVDSRFYVRFEFMVWSRSYLFSSFATLIYAPN